MDSITLLEVVIIGTVAVVGVATVGFILFSRFMRSEEARGKRFREMHGTPPPDER